MWDFLDHFWSWLDLIDLIVHWRFWGSVLLGGGAAALLCRWISGDGFALGAWIACLGVSGIAGFLWDCGFDRWE